MYFLFINVGDRFQFVGGELRFYLKLNYEEMLSFCLIVEVKDDGFLRLFSIFVFNIIVMDCNDFLMGFVFSGGVIFEFLEYILGGIQNGFVIGNFLIVDEDFGQLYVYFIVGGSEVFFIDKLFLVVVWVECLNFELCDFWMLKVCFIDFFGESVILFVEICLFDVNENLSGILLFVVVFFEYVLLGIVVGLLSVWDLDFYDNYMFVIVFNFSGVFLVEGKIIKIFVDVDFEMMLRNFLIVVLRIIDRVGLLFE